MLRDAAAVGIAVTALASRCGGDDFDPEGGPVGATLELVEVPVPIGVDPYAPPAPDPNTVRLGEREWGPVYPVVPSPLPEPLDQGDECLSGERVTVRVSSGEEVVYGPCRRPEEIEPLRRLLRRMMRERDR